MFVRDRRAAVAVAALAASAMLRAPDAQAKSRKAYWVVSLLGGVMVPLRDTADEREVGLGVGMRVGFTSKIGLGLTMTAQYSPLPVAEPTPANGLADDDAPVIENHFVAAGLVPRFTLGRGSVRLSIGAGGGGIMEQTRTRPAGEPASATAKETVFAGAALGELGVETYLWESGGLVVTGSYLRSFGDREAEVGSLLGGLIFTFR
ncbi:MAG TPA: hypothetical protein VEL05_10185 [Candidatus Acidoferrum sp.]|nr:hypothetical protein [Candidatus Acidoferrum sp.]